VNRVYDVCKQNPGFKREFEKHRAHYEAQFACLG
jgi:hypothetical protein